MPITRSNYKGHDIITVTNDKGLEMVFTNFGAAVYSIKYKNHYLTYHPESMDEFLKSKKYFGKTLGRVAGRIEKGLINIGGKDYQLETNEKGNTLHGGINNLSFVPWDVEVNENPDCYIVVFKRTSPDKACGFPGEVRFITVYNVFKNINKFAVHYHAVPKIDTPINLSTHIYWRLGDKDILNHKLYIYALNKTTRNDELINTGFERITRSFDFRIPKKVGADIQEVAKAEPSANGYDHGFIFETTDRAQATLEFDKLHLSLKTDMDMVNIYTNCFTGKEKIKEYGDDIIYGGIAIEPQMYFKSYKDIIYSPNKPFDHFFSFELEEY